MEASITLTLFRSRQGYGSVIVFSSARLHVWNRATKKQKEDAGSWSADRPIRSVLIKTSPSDRPISRVQEEKTRFPSRPIRSVWQDDKADASSYRQVASAQPIKSLRSILRTNHKTKLLYRPFTSFGRTIFRTNFHIGQSHPSDGPSIGQTFRIGQSNHFEGYLAVINGHSLRSHPQDRIVRPSS